VPCWKYCISLTWIGPPLKFGVGVTNTGSGLVDSRLTDGSFAVGVVVGWASTGSDVVPHAKRIRLSARNKSIVEKLVFFDSFIYIRAPGKCC